MDQGAWKAMVHVAPKNQTGLNRLSTHEQCCTRRSTWGGQPPCTTLSLPVLGHVILKNFFRAAFISFNNALQFSDSKFCPFLGKFIPKYFILFDAAVNGFVFLTLFQVQTNATDFF